jgi:tRNA nucleotidyltransferase (CCA-adding enzyme)
MKFLVDLKKDLQPSGDEKKRIVTETNYVLKKLNSRLRKAKAILGGSGAKGTWLRGIIDIDIFVCYNYKKFSKHSSELSDLLQPVLKKLFRNVRRIHGSRDYFQLKRRNLTFEIVPILSVRKASDAKNITDVSPLHARWVKKNLADKADEVRLLKAFYKAQNIYGAESHIKGFSGYVCEILIAYYGSFLKLLRAAAKWKAPVIIDVEKHYRNSAEVLRNLNKSKLSPLIVIDPVQKDRNAAAALSEKSFERFKITAKKFIRHPSDKFFVKKTPSVDEIKRNKNVIVVSVKPLRGKEDIVASKVLKVMKYIEENMQQHDFKLVSSDWFWSPERALLWFILEATVIAKEKRILGPPVKNSLHAERFKRAHKGAFKEKGRLYAVVKRKFVNADKLVKHLLKESYVTSRIKSAEVV